MKRRTNALLERIIIGGVCCIVLALACLPLFHAGLFPTIDDISVVRLEAMYTSLQSGQFPVRYVSSLARGHGYMLFDYYAPLPFYVGAFVHLLGVNLVGALKRTFLVAFVLGAVGVFGMSAELFGNIGGMVSSMVYLFSPFLGYDVYWRGGLDEAWAMSLVPWVMWFTYRGIRRRSWVDVVIAGCAWAAVLLSHNLTAFLSLLFIVLWAAGWVRYFRRPFWFGFGGIVLGFGLAAFFWMPAFIDHGQVWVSYLQGGRDDLFKNFVWGTIPNVLFPTFIPMITNWFVYLVPIGLYIALRKYAQDRLVRYAGGLTIGLFILAAFLASGFSRPVWNLLFPIMYIFQFPWRFLTMVTVFGAILAGAVTLVPKRYVLIGSTVVILGAILVNWANFRPRTYEFVDRYLPEDPCGTSWGFEYLPVWVTTCLKTTWTTPYRITAGDVRVVSVADSGNQIDLVTESTTSATIESSRYFYPGWYGDMDGQAIAITPSYPYGLMEVSVPYGRHHIRFRLGSTPLQQGSNALSLGTGVGIFVYACWEFWKRTLHQQPGRKK